MRCFACGFDGREDKMWVAPVILRDLNGGKEVKASELHRFVVCVTCRGRLISEQGVLESGFRSFKDTHRILSDREAAAARADKKLGILGAALKKAGLVKETEPASDPAETAAPTVPVADIIPAGDAAPIEAQSGGNGVAH